MNINIQSINFKRGITLETFIREKVARLFHQSNNIIRADIVLHKERNRKPVNKICEIKLMVPGYDHIVKKNTGDFYASVSEAVQALGKILRSAKTKKISKRYDSYNYNEV